MPASTSNESTTAVLENVAIRPFRIEVPHVVKNLVLLAATASLAAHPLATRPATETQGVRQ